MHPAPSPLLPSVILDAPSSPQTSTKCNQVTDELVRSGGVDLVAIDSVSALTPRAEVEGEIGAVLVGAQARLMSSALRKLAGNAHRMGVTLMFINQIRHKVGVGGRRRRRRPVLLVRALLWFG